MHSFLLGDILFLWYSWANILPSPHQKYIFLVWIGDYTLEVRCLQEIQQIIEGHVLKTVTSFHNFFPSAKSLLIFPSSKWRNESSFIPFHQKQRSHCVHWHPWRHQFLDLRQLNWLWYHWLLASRHAKRRDSSLSKATWCNFDQIVRNNSNNTKRQNHSFHWYGVNMLRHTDHDTIYANRVGQIRINTQAKCHCIGWKPYRFVSSIKF